jgi:hypothetical protein
MMALDAIFDVGAITLAGWTAVVVFRNRQRTRELRSAANPYYALMIRTLLFAMMVTVAFVTNIAIVLTSFSNHVAWVVISFTAMLVVFVFGSDPTIMRILVCQRDADAAPVVSEHSISLSLPPHAHGERVRASGIQNGTELLSIRRAPGLISESEWKSIVLDGLAFKSIERLEDLLDDSGPSREAKYMV